MKSAKVLLEVIVAEEARAGQVGPVLILEEPDASPPLPVVRIPNWDVPDPEPGVRVDVAVLREALLTTAPRRHGNPSKKSLEPKHIEALAKLDAHPVLNSLHSEYGDRREAKERVRDQWRRGHAENFLELLSEKEVDRRVRAAQDLLPFDPKERLASLGLQDCPVCDQETLLAEHLDDFGIGIGVGTCFVCGYYRSPAMVDDEAFSVHVVLQVGARVIDREQIGPASTSPGLLLMLKSPGTRCGCYLFSVTVVSGCRRAVDSLTYRPVIALRWDVPEERLLPEETPTEVRGWRAAAAAPMYLPVMALRCLAMMWTSLSWEARSWSWNRITEGVSA